MTPKIIVVAGPTASGKTALALEIAQKSAKQNINSVIINADSQQIYRELRILTARPTPEEEAITPHKLYGIMAASENSSAGSWLRYAKMEIDWALEQGTQPIVVGGTGLYLKALMQGINKMPDIPPEVRNQAISDYEGMGKEAFAGRLREIDPAFFERLKVYDRQRLIRAYEVWLGSGKTLTWWQTQPTTPPYATEQFELHTITIPREELYARCDARFTRMIEQGAIQEVEALLALDLPDTLPVMKSVGVPELAAYIRGSITMDQAIAQGQQATRNYAKRQLTWFRNQL